MVYVDFVLNPLALYDGSLQLFFRRCCMKRRVFVVIVACMCGRGFSQDGILKTSAGIGAYDDLGDNAPAVNASVKNAVSVFGLSDGSYLVVDNDANRVRKVDSAGIIST